MDQHWSFDHYELTPPIKVEINQRVKELERFLQSFQPQRVSLQGHISCSEGQQRYGLTLSLKVAGTSLKAMEEGRDVMTLMHSGFDKLERKVARHMKGQPQQKPSSRGRELPEAVARPAEPVEAKGIIDQHVPRVSQYVQREIDYYLTTGELMPDLIRVDDVVDEVVMRALTEGRMRPTILPFHRWLITLAGEVLQRQVQQLQARRETSGDSEERVEQKLSRVSPEQAGSAVEDEMYDWYQPDEKLRVEDVLPDPHTQSPEDIAVDRQLEQDLDRTIAFLPKPLRDVFVLYRIEGFTLDEVSIVTGRGREQVEEDLLAAQEFLREQLTQPGVAKRSGARDAAGGA